MIYDGLLLGRLHTSETLAATQSKPGSYVKGSPEAVLDHVQSFCLSKKTAASA